MLYFLRESHLSPSEEYRDAMRIGIDMDGTLINNNISWVSYYDDRHSLHNHSEGMQLEWPSWEYVYDLCGTCFKDVILNKDVLLQATLMPGAIPALKKLRQYGELWLISHRDPSLTLTGIQLLKKLSVYDLFTSYDWSFASKLETCTKYGISVMVDDSPKNIQELEGTPILPIIYDQSYNKGVPGLRAYGWNEVPTILTSQLLAV